MIFGKNEEQKRHAKNVMRAKGIVGRKRFALFPMKLSDGRYVWLEVYYAVTHSAIVTNDGVLCGDRYKKPIRYTEEMMKDYCYARRNLIPLNSYHEDCIARASMGIKTQNSRQYAEWRNEMREKPLAERTDTL